MRYDWNRYGHPGIARFYRIAAWFTAAIAIALWPSALWLAVFRDWTLIVLPLPVTAGTVTQRLALRKVYGVREAPRVWPQVPQLTQAQQIAVAVEEIRQRQWNQVTEQAYRAKPPPVRLIEVPPKVTGAAPRPPTVPGVSMALAGARLAPAFGPCVHRNAEPVDLIVTGERVAWVCPQCDAVLPADGA